MMCLLYTRVYIIIYIYIYIYIYYILCVSIAVSEDEAIYSELVHGRFSVPSWYLHNMDQDSSPKVGMYCLWHSFYLGLNRCRKSYLAIQDRFEF